MRITCTTGAPFWAAALSRALLQAASANELPGVWSPGQLRHYYGGPTAGIIGKIARSEEEWGYVVDELAGEGVRVRYVGRRFHLDAIPDSCPVGDPDCETGDDGSCHDACEAPL